MSFNFYVVLRYIPVFHGFKPIVLITIGLNRIFQTGPFLAVSLSYLIMLSFFAFLFLLFLLCFLSSRRFIFVPYLHMLLFSQSIPFSVLQSFFIFIFIFLSYLLLLPLYGIPCVLLLLLVCVSVVLFNSSIVSLLPSLFYFYLLPLLFHVIFFFVLVSNFVISSIFPVVCWGSTVPVVFHYIVVSALLSFFILFYCRFR